MLIGNVEYVVRQARRREMNGPPYLVGFIGWMSELIGAGARAGRLRSEGVIGKSGGRLRGEWRRVASGVGR